MTTIDEQAGTARTDGLSDASAQLSRWPWNALRPARGGDLDFIPTGGVTLATMGTWKSLLDSDDFDVMLGNPRGKHMLHNAWLHGSGVVWGFSVETNGEWELKVSPGLGLDGIGRELHLDADRCISVQGMLDKAVEDCRESTVEFWVSTTFATATRPAKRPSPHATRSWPRLRTIARPSCCGGSAASRRATRRILARPATCVSPIFSPSTTRMPGSASPASA